MDLITGKATPSHEPTSFAVTLIGVSARHRGRVRTSRVVLDERMLGARPRLHHPAAVGRPRVPDRGRRHPQVQRRKLVAAAEQGAAKAVQHQHHARRHGVRCELKELHHLRVFPRHRRPVRAVGELGLGPGQRRHVVLVRRPVCWGRVRDLWARFSPFDCFELDLRGHIGAGCSLLLYVLKFPNVVLI